MAILKVLKKFPSQLAIFIASQVLLKDCQYVVIKLNLSKLQVTISFAKIILVSIQPGVETLGKLPGTRTFCDVFQYPMAINIPGVLIIRVKSAGLCFANASFVRERYIDLSALQVYIITERKIYVCRNNLLITFCLTIMRWVTEEEEDAEGKIERTTIKHVILDLWSK